MRRFLVCLLMLLVADVAGAASIADKFKATVQSKVAPPYGTINAGKWKAFCVCNTNNQVGVLESFNGIPHLGITCNVPTFTTQGDVSGAVACYDWTPVTK
jgi:hypothetical protein